MPIIHREALGPSRPMWCDALIGEAAVHVVGVCSDTRSYGCKSEDGDGYTRKIRAQSLLQHVPDEVR